MSDTPQTCPMKTCAGVLGKHCTSSTRKGLRLECFLCHRLFQKRKYSPVLVRITGQQEKDFKAIAGDKEPAAWPIKVSDPSQ